MEGGREALRRRSAAISASAVRSTAPRFWSRMALPRRPTRTRSASSLEETQPEGGKLFGGRHPGPCTGGLDQPPFGVEVAGVGTIGDGDAVFKGLEDVVAPALAPKTAHVGGAGGTVRKSELAEGVEEKNVGGRIVPGTAAEGQTSRGEAEPRVSSRRRASRGARRRRQETSERTARKASRATASSSTSVVLPTATRGSASGWSHLRRPSLCASGNVFGRRSALRLPASNTWHPEGAKRRAAAAKVSLCIAMRAKPSICQR